MRGGGGSGMWKMTCFNAGLMKKLDTDFSEVYLINPGKKSVKLRDTFMGHGEEADEAWKTYAESIIEIFQTAELTEDTDLPTGFMSCAELSLCWTEETHPFPFLTSSMIEAFHLALSEVNLSIIEVSFTSPFWFTKLGLICSPGLAVSKIFNNFLSLLIPSKRTVANATSCE